MSQPGASIPTACRGWTETLAAYRFFDNEKVTADGVLDPHLSATKARMSLHETVLCVQDTTQLDYTSQSQLEGLGPLQYENENGLNLHATLALTPDRLCLGVLDTLMWARDPDQLGKATPLRKQKRIEEKESLRWINGYRHICQIAQKMPNCRCIYIADREGDMYELFVEGQKQKHSADWLVRAAYDRALSDNEQISQALIYAPALGTTTFELPANHERSGQTVTQTLKSVRVNLRPPYRPEDKLAETEVTVLLAQECKPPKGEKPLTWIFLTNLEANTADQVVEKIQWYLCRWQIEVYFRVLKSGCQIEELQLEHIKRLKPALALYMIVAWRVQYLTMLGRECPDLPCDLVFDKPEWQAIYMVSQKKSPPNEPPPLNDIIRMLASFGGFLGRKNDGAPGPKSIWIGLQRSRDFVLALDAYSEIKDSHT